MARKNQFQKQFIYKSSKASPTRDFLVTRRAGKEISIITNGIVYEFIIDIFNKLSALCFYL